MDYFAVDIETSGPVPGIHSLLSLGAVHVKRFDGRYQLFERIYLELKPIYEGFYPPAMAIHGLDEDRLREEGLEPTDAFLKFHDWIRANQKKPSERPVFVAHNAPFDWMFCAYYFGHTQVPNPFGHSAIDTKALAMGKLGIPWNETSLKQVAARLKMPERDVSTLHHAEADAVYQALAFAELMNL